MLSASAIFSRVTETPSAAFSAAGRKALRMVFDVAAHHLGVLLHGVAAHLQLICRNAPSGCPARRSISAFGMLHGGVLGWPCPHAGLSQTRCLDCSSGHVPAPWRGCRPSGRPGYRTRKRPWQTRRPCSGTMVSVTLLTLHVEHDGLAGQLLVVVLGEGDVDVLLLTGAHADDLLLKAGDELSRLPSFRS